MLWMIGSDLIGANRHAGNRSVIRPARGLHSMQRRARARWQRDSWMGGESGVNRAHVCVAKRVVIKCGSTDVVAAEGAGFESGQNAEIYASNNKW